MDGRTAGRTDRKLEERREGIKDKKYMHRFILRMPGVKYRYRFGLQLEVCKRTIIFCCRFLVS